MFNKKCGCREGWREERLALLTQISDLQTQVNKLLDQGLEERKALHERYLSFIKPQPQSRPTALQAPQPPRWPLAYRPQFETQLEQESVLNTASGEAAPATPPFISALQEQR